MAADWSDLPKDLLICVANRLRSFDDIFAFGAVCASWRVAAGPAKAASRARQQLPRLVAFRGNRDDPTSPALRAEIDSLSPWRRRRTFQLGPSSRIRSAEAVFSSLGWVLMNSRVSYEVSLFHPLSGAEISLPDLEEHSVGKFVLTASPSRGSDDYKVILLVDIFGDRSNVSGGRHGFMAFWKPGNVAWTRVRAENLGGIFGDVVYCNGLVWAVDVCSGKIVAMSIEGVNERTTIPAAKVTILNAPEADIAPMFEWRRRVFYVVESEGEVLVVRAERAAASSHCRNEPYTASYQVFKRRGDGEFERLSSLGDRALFLGNNSSSFSVKASDFAGCEPNCIYFAEEFWHRDDQSKIGTTDCEVGIFSLEDETFLHYYFANGNGNRGCFFSPLWVQPTFLS